ncbi:MAG: hypothetical protein Q8O84_05465 [Nanoarchaeota archaeon]|nr:hypothetical protein [Nanoarchaeota archaeon]
MPKNEKTPLELLNSMIQNQKKIEKGLIGKREGELITEKDYKKQMKNNFYAFDERLKKHKQFLKELGFPDFDEDTRKNVSKEKQDPSTVNESGDETVITPPLEKRKGSKTSGNRLEFWA